MAVKLPYDLEEEILSRVPFRSLARLRSVCKLWNSLISEERLIKKNLSRTHRYSGEHQFISRNNGLFCSVDIEEQQNLVDPPSLVIKDITLRKVRPEDDNAITVYRIVTCDGLLLCVMENQLMVWNPLLKETSWIKCGSDFHEFYDAYSLGYLSPCDYRILRFRCASNSRNRPPRVEVCQVASKTWKIIATISFDWFLSVPLSTISLRGTPYWIGLREDHTAFLQSFDFSKERFQPIGHLPFRYDELNPIALEIFKGDRLSVVEQCHKTRKICIWVKHWLMLAWTRFVVVDTPHLPLLYRHLSHLSTTYFFDKHNRLIITSVGTDGLYINRVISEKDFQATRASVGLSYCPFICNYTPSLLRIPGFSNQDMEKKEIQLVYFDFFPFALNDCTMCFLLF